MIAVLFVLALVFFTALIWVGGALLGAPLVVKIALTVIVLAVFGLVLLARYILRLQAAARIERGVLASAQVANAPPDRRADILQLQRQAQQAIRALKQSRLARGGNTALYALPWYVIVGPPGAGKTTAIRHSGLEFPLDQAGGASAFRGTGGTRNCDWWFTNEAILLDTAGRYSSDSTDQQEWFAFLDLLLKNRPRKPIDGLLVAVPVTDIAGAKEEDIVAFARRLRARLDEVLTRLKMQVPIYLILTKTDLVAGFAEFWNDLHKSERGQIFGMSFSKDPVADAKGAFLGELDLLLGAVHARLLRRLASERNVFARRAAFAFPPELASLRDNLGEFVATLFQDNAFQQTPLLRACFFTSGTQTARPMSRLLGSMASAYGLSLPVANAAPLEPRSYFLTDAFRKVLFRDQSLAGQSAAEKRRQVLVRQAVAGFTVLVAACLVLPAIFSWFGNHALVSSTAEISQQVIAAPWGDPSQLDRSAPTLAVAQSQLKEFDLWSEEGPPVGLRWGMYTGTDLAKGLEQVYVAALSRALVSATKQDLEDYLRAMDSSPTRAAETLSRDLEALKLYLMLGTAEHVDSEWAAKRLVRRWSLVPHAHVKNEEQLLADHVAYMFDLIRTRRVPPFPLDETLVRTAQAILKQVPQMDRLYEALVADANKEVRPVGRLNAFAGDVAPFVQSGKLKLGKEVVVAGAYTKLGWLRVRARLGAQQDDLVKEGWVLGDADDASAKDLVSRLSDTYFERYVNAWRDFLLDLQVQPGGNSENAIKELNVLAEPEWPYQRLIRLVSDNVTLDMVDPASKTAIVEKAVDVVKQKLEAGGPPMTQVSRVEEAFRPLLDFGIPARGGNPHDPAPATKLKQYTAILTKVASAMPDLGDADADPRKSNDFFKESTQEVTELLSDQSAFTRPLLAPLLKDPIARAWDSIGGDIAKRVNARWQSGPWQKWHDKLEGKYPFANSAKDAPLNDFLDFFQPGDGVLAAFYEEVLKAYVVRDDASFTVRRTASISSPFLEGCMHRGFQFGSVLFPKNSRGATAMESAVVFDVNVHSVSPSVAQVIVEIDGATHSYRNEPEQWLSVTWPGKAQHGAKLRIRGAGGLDEEISRPGDFGFFRLLQLAEVKAGQAADGTPTLVATWDLRATREKAVVSLDLRPTRSENPLVPGYFRDYRCPPSIAGR